MTDLSSAARTLFASGKGILAADESVASADKRLALYGVTGTEENRRKFRDLFLSTPGIEDYLSGVILYAETLDQKADDGTLFPVSLASRGIVPGIKVDEGLEPFPESTDETITKGVLGLCDRLSGFVEKYHTGFTKWRMVVRIDGDRLPTAQALVENAKRLAVYARDVQEVGMVPLIEPEVLYEGKHSQMRARQVIEATMKTVFDFDGALWSRKRTYRLTGRSGDCYRGCSYGNCPIRPLRYRFPFRRANTGPSDGKSRCHNEIRQRKECSVAIHVLLCPRTSGRGA